MTDQFLWFQVQWTATVGIRIHPTKAWLSLLVNFKNAIWTLEERYAIKLFSKFGKKAMREKLDLLLWCCYKHAGSPRSKKARQSKSNHKLFMIPFFDSTIMIYMHWVATGQTVNKEYYVEIFKGVQQEIPSEEASTFQIGPVTFPAGQFTSPQLHPCHRLFEQDGH